MIQTPVIWDTASPQWNLFDRDVQGWVPGDPLRFKVYDKDQGKPYDDQLGEVTLGPGDFYPNGFRGEVPLQGTAGNYSTLELEIECLNVAQGGRLQQFSQTVNRKLKNLGAQTKAAFVAAIAAIEAAIGEGDPERQDENMGWMVFVPFFVFMWVIMLWIMVRHYSMLGAQVITLITIGVLVAMTVMGFTSHKDRTFPLAGLGLLCLLAVVMGVIAGNHGWGDCWRQYWWMNTGVRYGGDTAAKPAAARIDAATVQFVNGTAIDPSRAAGYQAGDIYCAAPILDPSLLGAQSARVEYWAIGVNCCGLLGSYTCDGARDGMDGTGVVMVEGGMPCIGCNADKFRLAAAKAGGANNLVASKSALFVRWVKNPTALTSEYLMNGVMFLFSAGFIGLLTFMVLGALANFKGFCKPGCFPLNHITGKSEY